MTQRIPDFSDADRWAVKTALKERYGERVAVAPADSELRLEPASKEVTVCPTPYREQRGVEFMIFKIAADRYRPQFYYSLAEQYGTGRDFDDLAERAVITLRLQADHENDRAGARSGKTDADPKNP